MLQNPRSEIQSLITADPDPLDCYVTVWRVDLGPVLELLGQGRTSPRKTFHIWGIPSILKCIAPTVTGPSKDSKNSWEVSCQTLYVQYLQFQGPSKDSKNSWEVPCQTLYVQQCWGSERFYSDLDSDSAPVFQTHSDSAPIGSGSESEYIRIRIRILVKIYLMRLSQFKLSPIKKNPNVDQSVNHWDWDFCLKKVFIILTEVLFSVIFQVSFHSIKFELCLFIMESKVLLCKIFIRILSDPDPNPNGLIGFGFGFGSLKTFGSFRIRIWIRIRIPNTDVQYLQFQVLTKILRIPKRYLVRPYLYSTCTLSTGF